MEVLIVNTFENEVQTIGQLHVVENNKSIYSCRTLQLPWRDNKKNVSRVPIGKYTCRKRVSPKFGMCFILEDVPNRSYILIHPGNYHSQIRGCILVGKYFKDINKDGYADVVYSKNTIEQLLDILPNRFILTIK